MKCSLCGIKFSVKDAESGCSKCHVFIKGCGLTKCPNCGFELVRELEKTDKKNKRGKKNGTNR